MFHSAGAHLLRPPLETSGSVSSKVSTAATGEPRMEKSPAIIDIVISEDHAMVREGLRMMLQAEPGLRVVGEAADGEETIRLVPQLNPQILVLDLSLPKVTGLEALRELSKLGLPTRTIILTAAIEKEQIIEGLQLGAHGIVLKDSAIELLIEAIRCVNSGRYWIGHESVGDLIQALRQMNPPQRPPVASRDFGLTPVRCRSSHSLRQAIRTRILPRNWGSLSTQPNITSRTFLTSSGSLTAWNSSFSPLITN